MLHSARPLLFAGALALLAFAPVADKVTFHPSDGSDAQKKFALEGDFELGDISLIVDGSDVSSQMPLSEFSGEFDIGLSVVDHYIKTVDGKPLHLEREYGSSSASFSAMENAESKEDLFEVDGKTVVFKWDEEKGEYKRSLKDAEGEADKLDELGIDLDYRSLLPEKSVSTGDKWEVAPKALITALFFGAEMKNLAELSADDPEFAEIADEIIPAIEKLFETFKAQCEYAGAREEDGVQVGQIKVAVNSEGTADLSEAIGNVIRKQTEGQGVDLDLRTANFTVKIRGDGVLLWDLSKGLARSFQMDSEVELLVEIDMSVTDPNGGDHSAEMNAELLGHAKWSMQ